MKNKKEKKPSRKTQTHFDPIEEVLKDFKKGKMVIVTDDKERENEGDLVMAASKVTAQSINFMTLHGRGLVCAPLTPERTFHLGLQRMVLENRESFKTDFTISVDAHSGITTGISASDRAKTIRVLASPNSLPKDLVQPGHIFPLQAKLGGVLQRAGHTEAAIDLVKITKMGQAAVICEILKEDGNMARLPDLIKFKKKHGLKICSIIDLIEYRRQKENFVSCVEKVKMPTDYGLFDLHLYRSELDNQEHLALVMGKMNPRTSTLVRVHSECLTGDVFSSQRCDCGTQLNDALKIIAKKGHGVLVYMRQEGRGIGLKAKMHAYRLQEEGLDTVDANIKLGFPPDLREYGLGAQILVDLGIKNIRLLTNNPKKVVGLSGYGLKIIEQLPIQSKPNAHNHDYLKTKSQRMQHSLNLSIKKGSKTQ